jgi:hypothetical protein
VLALRELVAIEVDVGQLCEDSWRWQMAAVGEDLHFRCDKRIPMSVSDSCLQWEIATRLTLEEYDAQTHKANVG